VSSPLVTVLIPTRNRAELLENAISSVCGQTHRNLQIIICDNNSNEMTSKVVERFNDQRILYLRSDKDLTLLDNWARGLRCVEGEYFVRLDDDNEFLPTFVEDCLRLFERHGASVVAFNNLNVTEGSFAAIFPPDGCEYVLTAEQWVHLEFHYKIDSNYSMYHVQSLRRYFPSFEIYETALPDRYLGYRLADWGCKMVFSTKINGITRFDYDPPSERLKRLPYVYVSYGSEMSSRGEGENSQFNYDFHRISIINKFQIEVASEKIRNFINIYELSPWYAETGMKFGHMVMRRRLHMGEYGVFVKYATSILWDYIKNGCRGVAMNRSAFYGFLSAVKQISRISINSLWKEDSYVRESTSIDDCREFIWRGDHLGAKVMAMNLTLNEELDRIYHPANVTPTVLVKAIRKWKA